MADPNLTPRKCKFSLSIEIYLAQEIVTTHAPTFRFKFLDGSKKQTSTIGATGWILKPSTISEAQTPCFHIDQQLPEIEFTETFAKSMDQDPILTFFLSDNMEGRKELYLGIYELDTSSLLSGATTIEQTFNHWSHLEKQYNSAVEDDDVFRKKNKKNTTMNALPSSGVSLFNSESAIEKVTFRLTVDQPILSPGLLQLLNPLSITILNIKRLPGVNTTGSNPHLPLRKHCRPVYVAFRFLPQKLGEDQVRLVYTNGMTQDSQITYNQTFTVLCGRFPDIELLDAVASCSLDIEIHDRDLKREEQFIELQSKWLESATLKAAKDPFVLDEMVRKECHQELRHATEAFPHGIARLRLAELLNPAKKKMRPPQGTNILEPYMQLKLAADVIPMKRRASPNDEEVNAANNPSLLDLTTTEKKVREPGSYLSSGTSLQVLLTLKEPIELKSRLHFTRNPINTTVGLPGTSSVDGKFSRMVFILPYKDSSSLIEIQEAMASVNLTSIPNVPIRSYQMTNDQKKASENGTLDVITGFEIIDSEFRMIFLEGLESKGMKFLSSRIQRQQTNDPKGYRLFANQDIFFTERLYNCFEIDLKRIKLRYPLSTLMTFSDIYMRTKVSENCFQALIRLTDIKKMNRLIELKELNLFPTPQMLLEVESKYGESITLEDIHGEQQHFGAGYTPSFMSNTKDLLEQEKEKHERIPNGGSEGISNTDQQQLPVQQQQQSLAFSSSPEKQHGIRKTFKAPTEAKNPMFEEFLKTRTATNYLDLRKTVSDQKRQEYQVKKAQQEVEEQANPLTQHPVFMYSGQRLRTQTILQDEMRQRLAKDHKATYTYSKDFHSLSLSLVNPEALREAEEEASRKLWTTQKGFIYPAPRKKEEYYKHPDALSEARKEDLKQPFVDNIYHPKPLSREQQQQQENLVFFSTLPSKDMIFGGTNGDGTKNEIFFKSVHLCGDGLQKEMEEAKKKEQKEWEEKLVVDKKQLKFLAHGNTQGLPRSKPSQLDRLNDILDGIPRSKPLRIIRNAKLPSGQKIPLVPPPASIQNQQEYLMNPLDTFVSTLRGPSDPTLFLGTNPETGVPKDFFFPPKTTLLVPTVKQFTTHTKIQPVPQKEKIGPVWVNTSTTTKTTPTTSTTN